MRNKNHLKVPAGTKNFTSNSARIWNTISTKMNVNVTLVQFNNIIIKKIIFIHTRSTQILITTVYT